MSVVSTYINTTLIHITLHTRFPRSLLNHLDLQLLLRRSRSFRILQRMWHQLIPKQNVHLLQSLAHRLGVEQDVAQQRYHVEGEEDVEVAEADCCQGLRAKLGED